MLFFGRLDCYEAFVPSKSGLADWQLLWFVDDEGFHWSLFRASSYPSQLRAQCLYLRYTWRSAGRFIKTPGTSGQSTDRGTRRPWTLQLTNLFLAQLATCTRPSLCCSVPSLLLPIHIYPSRCGQARRSTLLPFVDLSICTFYAHSSAC